METNIKKIYELNAIKLAYMGDAVFSMFVRKHFIVNTEKKNAQLNKAVNQIVCAKNQAKIIDAIKDDLTDIEIDVITRARNLHFNNIAKNSTLEEYSKATEFEALLGYLYLTDQHEKLDQIINKSLEMYYDSGRN